MYKVEIPEYVDEVKLSDKKRKKPWLKSKITKDKPLPLKYQNDRFIWKDGKLWDTVEKEIVAKNSKTVGKPNIIGISGNPIMRQMHEQTRMKITNTIKDSFRKHIHVLPKPLPAPLQISMELHCPSGYGNWDLDNLWIYHKCMQDLLQEEGYLENDTVQFITGASGILYVPVPKRENRKMIFFFKKDDREVIRNHNLFSMKIRGKRKPELVISKEVMQKVNGGLLVYDVVETNKGKAGEIQIDAVNQVFSICTGRSMSVYGAAKKGLGHVYSQCVQWNCEIAVSYELWEKYQKFFEEEILNKSIQLYIYGSGNQIHSGAQDVSDKVRANQGS